MASKGYARVRPVHSASLIKRYRRLLGERRFWATRSHHPQAAPELARLNAAAEALANAIPLVAPDILPAKLKALPFHLAVPLPGHALTRAVLAGLRKLGAPTEEELTSRMVADTGIDLELHDLSNLQQRVRKALDSLTAKGGLQVMQALPKRWSLREP